MMRKERSGMRDGRSMNEGVSEGQSQEVKNTPIAISKDGILSWQCLKLSVLCRLRTRGFCLALVDSDGEPVESSVH